MANNQLILGAGKAAKKFVDVGAEMMKGLASSGLTVRGFKKPNIVTENEKYQARVNSLMGKMKTGIDFTSFSPAETSSMRTFLGSERNKYAEAAKALAGMTDTTSSEYMAQVDIMNGVNNSFKNLASQIKSYKKSKVEFVEGMVGGIYSSGNDPKNTRQNTLIYLNQSMYGHKDADGDGISDEKMDAPFTIMDGGNIGFNIDGEVKSYNETSLPLLKDYKLGGEILTKNESVRKAGDLVSPESEKLYRIELESAFASQDALRSFIYDFEDEFPTEDLGTLWEENPDNGKVVQEIKKELIDRLITSRREAGQAGYNEKQAKENRSSRHADNKATNVDMDPGTGKHFLVFPNGDRIAVSKKRHDAVKTRITNQEAPDYVPGTP